MLVRRTEEACQPTNIVNFLTPYCELCLHTLGKKSQPPPAGWSWARGKRRGFSPSAAARHSPSARVHPDKNRRKHNFPQFFLIEPALTSGRSRRTVVQTDLHANSACWACFEGTTQADPAICDKLRQIFGPKKKQNSSEPAQSTTLT